jgi:thioredoxin-like negative regulator of GroEL
MEAATEADSRLFDLFIESKNLAENQSSKDQVNSKIKLACENTVKKAIEFESDFLMEEAKTKMKNHFKDGFESFSIESDMKYASAFGLEEDYINASKKYAKKIVSKNAKSMNRLAMQMEATFPKSERVLAEAVKICQKSIKLEKENIGFRINLAKIQLAAEQNEEALKTAKETLEIATKLGENTRQLNGLIKYIESIINKT